MAPSSLPKSTPAPGLSRTASGTDSSSKTTTPTLNIVSLPDEHSSTQPIPIRPRVHSNSTVTGSPNSGLFPLSRIPSEPWTTSSFAAAWSNRPRSRSSSFGKQKLSDSESEPSKKRASGSQTPPHGAPSSWWNRKELIPRGWKDTPRKKKTVPPEQTEAWLHTRARVAEAAASVLGTAGNVAHEALLMSVGVLRFVPIAGLAEGANLLLGIWDSLQLVDMNRMACLRLTERCADVLLSVRQEIADAGDDVGEELQLPLNKLFESFKQVQLFLEQQVHRPFLKRYLKRDEILRQIATCDSSLSDSLGLFSLSIQIRILKQVQSAERQRQADTHAVLKSLLATSPGTHPEVHTLDDASLLFSAEPEVVPSTPPASPPPYAQDTEDVPSTVLKHLDADAIAAADPAHVRAALRAIHARQNEMDQARDSVDLRSLMRIAIRAGSDAGLIEVLQVGRDEMPEAIKTLQRALEQELDKESTAVTDGGVAGAGAQLVARRVSVKEVSVAVSPVSAPPDQEVQATVTRRQTIVSVESSSSDSSKGARDTLNREFIETGIDALRRVTGGGVELPSWTITRYEVDREEKIGIGFFSDVYRGTWRGRTVAIKILAATTPRELFVSEVSIWKGLRHPNVLELYGASATTGEGPWFFVSPYMRNGSLVSYLKRIAAASRERHGSKSNSRSRSHSRVRGSGPGNEVRSGGNSSGGENTQPKAGQRSDDEVDMLKMMHEIARGMQYLHSMGVLHGDFKGANVLIDDKIRCVITDFGQSEMKTEVYRVSGTSPPHGTLRWQAPELMAGQNQLTTEIDVYAYAICCVEILTMGNLPWPLLDDDAVRHLVLKENQRPVVPQTRVSSSGLNELLRLCWHRDPFMRPSFTRIVLDVKQLRIGAGVGVNVDDRSMSPPSKIPDLPHPRPSPDMHPMPIPQTPPSFTRTIEVEVEVSPSSTDESYKTTSEMHTDGFFVPPLGDVNPVHSIMFRPSLNTSRASSLFTSVPESLSEDGLALMNFAGYESPPPADERSAELRNERRYRMSLTHEYHPSLTLPLWSPTPIHLGAVGYLSKPSGSFVTLFNAFDPNKSSGGVVKDIQNMYSFGSVSQGSQRQEKRTMAQRGLDAISSFLPFRPKGDGIVPPNTIRRFSSVLRSGHRAACLYAETTIYRYIEDLEVPKLWFKANVDAILQTYEPHHGIQKEDLYLVIGTLDAPDYAMFVSHQHPDGQVHFNVYSPSRTGHEWGIFTTDTDVHGGPLYHETPSDDRVSTNKVSIVGQSWDTLLIARLRFKPDVPDPTSLA